MVQFSLVTVHKVILYRCVETRQTILPGLGEHLRRIPFALCVLHFFCLSRRPKPQCLIFLGVYFVYSYSIYRLELDENNSQVASN